MSSQEEKQMEELISRRAGYLLPLLQTSLREARVEGRCPSTYAKFLGQLALPSSVLGGLIQPLPDGA